jgi:hypothetical protein
LEEDLRDEAQRNLGRLQTNQKYFRVSIAWYREVLRTARAAAPSAGSVTFVLPPRATLPPIMRPLDSVWAAAKASATVAVLPHDETETFGRVSYQAEQSMKAADVQISTLVAEDAVTSRLGVTLAPGETLQLTPEERDELMRAIALRLEATGLVSLQDARWEGSSEAVLHHVRSLDEMTPYLERAVAALPQ